jgi:DNA-binding CsgD family transcriptional regulator
VDSEKIWEPEKSVADDPTRFLNLISQLNEYLELKRPSLDEIVHFLTVRTLAPWDAERVFIARVDRAGVFRDFSFFGFPLDNSANWQEVHISDRVPMADAARNGTIVVASEEQIVEVYKTLVDRRSEWIGRTIIDVPIIKGGVSVGVMGIIFKGETPKDESFLPFLRSLASCIVFALDESRRKLASRRTYGPKSDLTDRQKKILEMMSQGLTNSAMASKLGFSESLIRQETVKIYRSLNVSNRREASQIFESTNQSGGE